MKIFLDFNRYIEKTIYSDKIRHSELISHKLKKNQTKPLKS